MAREVHRLSAKAVEKMKCPGCYCDGETIEYFVIPSAVVAKRLVHDKSKAGTSEWWTIYRNKIMDYKDRWNLFL